MISTNNQEDYNQSANIVKICKQENIPFIIDNLATEIVKNHVYADNLIVPSHVNSYLTELEKFDNKLNKIGSKIDINISQTPQNLHIIEEEAKDTIVMIPLVI